MSGNPYERRPDRTFWRRAVTDLAPGALDPVSGPTFRIEPGTPVTTLGSCFAQEISTYLVKTGCQLLVSEPAPAGMDAAEARRRNYGVYSARYGNVYTPRQALQLIERALGIFRPVERAWRRDGVLVDPFRPTIEPDGFATEEALEQSRRTHLACTREMFASCEVLVFTLGMTEGWRSRIDGAVFPLAPGVSGGSFDPARHEFVNFRVMDVVRDLEAFCNRLFSLNPRARILLTVSPVPMIATYEDQHVVTASVYSKSVLRVAASEIASADDRVTYFPAYEIVAGFGAPASYYEDDLRRVSDAGLQHVMRIFARHFLSSAPNGAVATLSRPPGSEAICDEEEIEQAMRRQGLREASEAG